VPVVNTSAKSHSLFIELNFLLPQGTKFGELPGPLMANQPHRKRKFSVRDQPVVREMFTFATPEKPA
jgi:hypothetical protein